MKPRIGITSGLRKEEWLSEGRLWRAYAEAVERCGGEPVHLGRATLGKEQDLVRELDGFLFSGGLDIHLDRYPNPPDLRGESVADAMIRHAMEPEPDRDDYELPLLHAALDADKPVLGICRGAQVLNVGLGGRLVLDIPLETQTAIRHRGAQPEDHSPTHGIDIHEGTLLHEILPRDHYRLVNSRHHQAVRLDDAFAAKLAALSEDGLVEAIEVPQRRWAIGVQWHPEHRTDPGIRERFQPLFAAFVRAAQEA